MEYHLVTVWFIDAPIEVVYEAIFDSLNWPKWWGNVESVETIFAGDVNGIGNIRRYVWHGFLPYRLNFDIRATRIEPLVSIEGVASGDLDGVGCWSFRQNQNMTIVNYSWHVKTTSFGMNVFELFAYSIVKWNHNYVMRKGGEALANLLNVRLVNIMHYT